ncbi:MAG: biosynthetic arginine decarboxylase [Acidobacteriota bacterium]|nr:MAG: biosynthetic arginine decarboxylase [Acidobacteriota bacterium]
MIDRWGAGYFDVNLDGHLTVLPTGEEGPSISIFNVMQDAVGQGLKTPLLIRFQDLVRHRVRELNEAFRDAIQEFEYGKQYRGVYPIKVNQLREVVEEILDAGQPYRLGIEVGSKSEIFAALAVHETDDGLIVCNGYKDTNYIRTALLGRKMGKEVILVAEKLSEVEQVIQISKEMMVEPFLGLRMRLWTEGKGNWATSGGEQAKFGLSTSEILRAIELLREAGLESTLKLLHFHIGSQIPDIQTIVAAVREASRYYAKLRKMGHQIEYLDVGGGLAVDYDGSRSVFPSSMNYSLDEYARDVVYNIQDVCHQEQVPEPHIISESGRAIVAHHSVLVVNAFGSIRKTPERLQASLPGADHKLVQELLHTEEHLASENLLESWHDLIHVKKEAQKLFEVGLLDLEPKASIEMLFWRIAEKIRGELGAEEDDLNLPDELLELERQLADQHICNFSVFQSLLDHWALGQMFPIVPIHRLDEQPRNNSTLVDITCDSDGKVSRFVDLGSTREALPLHFFGQGPYFLGIFLTGAYQDIMGDIHNLFGRVNEVHVFLDEEEDSGYYIEERIEGNTISEVLAMTQYDSKDLLKRVKVQVDRAIKSGQIRPTEGMRLLDSYREGILDKTYLDV